MHRTLRILLFTAAIVSGSAAQQLSLEDELFAYVLGIEGKSHSERGEFIKTQLKRIGVPFVTIPFSEIRVHGNDTLDLSGENIVVRFGRGPKTIVVGAHYDAVPGSPGANDNGGGVAVVLALARSLRGLAWNYTVDLCFFDREEDGLIGSRWYVQKFVDPRRHLAMINLDVEGTGEEVYVGPVGGGDDDVLMPLVRTAAKTAGLLLVESAAYPGSDHESFGKQKLENISISIVPKGDGERLSKMVRGQQVKSKSDMPQVMRVMHTPDDSSREMSPDALKMSYDCVKGVLVLLNEVK